MSDEEHRDARGRRILVVDDDPVYRSVLSDALEGLGFALGTARDAETALALLESRDWDALVADLVLPGMNGVELTRRAKAIDPALAVILVTARASLESAVEAVRAHADDYLLKPTEPVRIARAILGALERLAVTTVPAPRCAPTPAMVHKSPQMAVVMELVARMAPAGVNVLVSGESGVGKELIAQALHRGSPRAAAPLVDVNCGAITPTLIESELFGHEKGAYTGAEEKRVGLFEVADGGTLLLDEVGELPLTLQVKLLRVLETGSFYRVGGTRQVRSDVRVIALTNRDLKEEVTLGRFRKDLYYRLNTVNIHVPPLRERRDDILVIARHHLRRRSGPGHRPRLSQEAAELLMGYGWPGNVRELQNALEGAVLLASDRPIAAIHLPREVRDAQRMPVGGTLKELERDTIVSALQAENWRRNQAARALGISLKTLYRKIKLYKLEDERLLTTARR